MWQKPTDDGSPPLSTTNNYTIFVNEVNLAPVLTLPPGTNIIDSALYTATATATDPDLPANTLTFALVSGPAGLTVSGGGAISWTPTGAQSPSTNTVTIRVTDNGSPNLSDTNSYTLTVISGTLTLTGLLLHRATAGSWAAAFGSEGMGLTVSAALPVKVVE